MGAKKGKNKANVIIFLSLLAFHCTHNPWYGFRCRWPGLLDNSVAGGIPYGLGPMESLIKECMEEASLPEDIAKNAKTVGCVTYFYQ